jgi:hypothetical protein
MAQNCKCTFTFGPEDPKQAIRKELAAGFDQYCKDAFSRGLSAMSFQEWMIDRLIEARHADGREGLKLKSAFQEEVIVNQHWVIETRDARIAELEAKEKQYRETFQAQEHKIAELHERIEKFEQLPNNGFTTLYATIVKNGEPVTIYTMDPTNIEHWKRRALSAEANEAKEITERLAAQDRTKELETRIEEYQARYNKRVMECAELSRRLEEIAGIANR